MAQWLRFSATNTISTAGAHANNQITALTNSGTNIWEEQDLFIVDGFIHIQTDTDNLCGVRLLVVPPTFVTGDLSDTNPSENDPVIKYSWWASRGPLPYRIKSKIRIPSDYDVWLTTWKELGGDSTVINVGMRLYIHQKG